VKENTLHTEPVPEHISPKQLHQSIRRGETFVLNIVTAWCPDCTERQAPNFSPFVDRMLAAGIPVYQITVQHERLVFLSGEHKRLVQQFGGHGYPRTALVLNGEALPDYSRVEIMTPLELDILAGEYIYRVKQG